MARGTTVGKVIESLARMAFGAVFVYAGVGKALDPSEFALAIDNYRLLPYPAAAALSVYLPWLEIVCGIGVLLPKARLGALSLLAGLCVIFTGAIASAWIRNLDITCGCFGGGAAGRLPLLASLARSILLAMAAGILLWREGRDLSRRIGANAGDKKP